MDYETCETCGAADETVGTLVNEFGEPTLCDPCTDAYYEEVEGL